MREERIAQVAQRHTGLPYKARRWRCRLWAVLRDFRSDRQRRSRCCSSRAVRRAEQAVTLQRIRCAAVCRPYSSSAYREDLRRQEVVDEQAQCTRGEYWVVTSRCSPGDQPGLECCSMLYRCNLLVFRRFVSFRGVFPSRRFSQPPCCGDANARCSRGTCSDDRVG